MLVHKAQFDAGFAYRLFLKDDAIPRKKGHDRVLEPQAMTQRRSWTYLKGRPRHVGGRWTAGLSGSESIINAVVLEQFISHLPKKTAQWVQCHRPASLDLAIQLAEDQLAACSGVGEPLPAVSLSLSLFPCLPPLSSPVSPFPLPLSPPSPKSVPLPRSRWVGPPRSGPRWRMGMEPTAGARGPECGMATPQRRGTEESSAASPRQFPDPLPATRAAGRPGPACWCCGDPGHFVDRCPVMEVGTLVRIPDDPQAAPDQAGLYQIPVSIKGGTYQALVDSGCNQTSKPETIRDIGYGRMVKVRCVHGDIVEYPVKAIAIKFRGQKHNVEVAVSRRMLG
ncbi:uncharacterized protein LOC128019494 [Carassius gibelio]|uniref:uncharacterized protein LOC128019494 n=1 Tax=Carassius gibelio TaxID=101364 RepID=UPI0022781F8C|nr:uncharacterized protein LOC128019494 [Carassius gibelio]